MDETPKKLKENAALREGCKKRKGPYAIFIDGFRLLKY